MVVVVEEVTDLGEKVRALDVDAVAFVKSLLGRALEVLQNHYGRARDQDVDLAEFLDRLRDHVFDIFDATGVAFDEERALVTDLLGDLLGRGRVGGVVDGDVGALFGEEEGGGSADAFAAAGDEGGFACKGARHGCGFWKEGG